ncbi:hypothetical protein EQZ23_14795 [Sphingomonas sp. UV9]|uniref:hypothetical protein n=1 Tax=Sphingomonas sp. UV9 TaxID=1851410 RepID=UPI000FFB1C10|nr:hypothetical protein [Sphingomonas sp. UV9]RXD03596.1 hypothetical protein EQZ23_14795 [Sphingomonas sp. UV9]
MTDLRRLRTDLSLRASGIPLLAVAVTAIHTLARLHPPISVLAFLLATIGFLCASAGAMLAIVGHHIHDRIQVSARWQRAERQGAPVVGPVDARARSPYATALQHDD